MPDLPHLTDAEIEDFLSARCTKGACPTCDEARRSWADLRAARALLREIEPSVAGAVPRMFDPGDWLRRTRAFLGVAK